VNVEEIQFEASGLRLAAKQWGNSADQPVLALHGWLDNAATYERLAPTLQGYRVIALEFAGHGHSAHRPEGARYHILDNVDEVFALSDALNLDRFHLVGHSMGAGVATYAAASFPERIRTLVLIEGMGGESKRADQAPDWLRQSIEVRRNANLKQKPMYRSRGEAVHARAQALGGISVDAATHLCERGLESVGGEFTWRSDLRLRLQASFCLTDDMVDAYLQRLTMPVLLVRGRHSILAGKATLQDRAMKAPRCRCVTLDGNHHLHLEAATFRAVADEVRGFLRENEGA